MIARLKQAAWDAEEAARPPPPPPEPQEEATDATAAAEPSSEAEPQLSAEAAEAEHAALIERLKQAAQAFNDSEEVQAQRSAARDHAPKDPVVVGGALSGRFGYDAPCVPSAERREPVQAVDDSQDTEYDAIRDYGGPVANAIAFAREMRAARTEARGREAAAKAAEEVKEVEPEVPYELTRFWAPETALFRISNRVLPMHLERAGVTPSEVSRIWEKEWGIAYASRLRFEAPPEAGTKWLNIREDALPGPPTVTRLEGKPPILDAVALALTQRDEELFQKSLVDGKERSKEAVVSHGGKWTKKSETFRWSQPNDYDVEEDGRLSLHPIWPPMEPPPMPEGTR